MAGYNTGAGWSALGAAIQNGMGAFQQRTRDIFDENRMKAQQAAADQQYQLGQYQLADMPAEMKARASERTRKAAIDKLTLQALEDDSNGNQGWELDPKGNVADTPGNRVKGANRKKFGLTNTVEDIYGAPRRPAADRVVPVQTIDANGQPVTKGVRSSEMEGQEYPSQPTATQKTKTADTQSALDTMVRMRESFNPDYVGPAASTWKKALNKIPGGSMLGTVDKGAATFYSHSAALKNAVIRAQTGAAMSAGEAERILQQIPTDEDAPDVWEANFKAAEQMLRSVLQRNSGQSTPTAAPEALQPPAAPAVAPAAPVPAAAPTPAATPAGKVTAAKINQMAKEMGVSPQELAKQLHAAGRF